MLNMIDFLMFLGNYRGNSSAGRALPCQGKGRGFESRFPLQPTPMWVRASAYAQGLRGQAEVLTMATFKDLD